MLKPISTKHAIRFTPEGQPDDGTPTVILLRPLSKAVMAAAMDAVADGRAGQTMLAVDLFRHAFEGVENFSDAEGNPVVPGERKSEASCMGIALEMCASSVVDNFPMRTHIGALTKLLKESEFTEDDRKNS